WGPRPQLWLSRLSGQSCLLAPPNVRYAFPTDTSSSGTLRPFAARLKDWLLRSPSSSLSRRHATKESFFILTACLKRWTPRHARLRGSDGRKSSTCLPRLGLLEDR